MYGNGVSDIFNMYTIRRLPDGNTERVLREVVLCSDGITNYHGINPRSECRGLVYSVRVV